VPANSASGYREKKVFKTVEEAKSAVAADNLATVYRRAGGVFVVTAFGSGVFTTGQWDKRDADR